MDSLLCRGEKWGGSQDTPSPKILGGGGVCGIGLTLISAASNMLQNIPNLTGLKIPGFPGELLDGCGERGVSRSAFGGDPLAPPPTPIRTLG